MSFLKKSIFFGIMWPSVFIAGEDDTQIYYAEYQKYSKVAELISRNDTDPVRYIAKFLDGGGKNSASIDKQLISPAAAASLDLVSQSPTSVFQVLAQYCKTEVGKLMLADMLLVSHLNSYESKKSKEEIKKFIDNTESLSLLRAKYEKFINRAEGHDIDFLTIIENLDAVEKTRAIPTSLGGSLFSMELRWRTWRMQTFWWGTCGIFSAATVPIFDGMSVTRNHMAETLRNVLNPKEFITSIAKTPIVFVHGVAKAVGLTAVWDAYRWFRGSNEYSKFSIICGLGISAIVCAQIGIAIKKARYEYDKDNMYIRKYMEAIAAVMELGSEKEIAIEIRNALRARIPGKLQEIYGNILHNELSCLFTARYPIMALRSAYQNLGRIDALSAVAQWAVDNKGHVSCVEFSENTLNLKDMWALEIGAKKSKKSSILLNEDQNVLKIEGPNGFGKSTILRMIGNNILLAERFGVVAAAKGSTVPQYSSLCYVANVQEMRGTQSTGQAQGISFKTMINSISSAKKQIFIVLDEPLSGTQSSVAQESIIKLIEAVCKNKNINVAFVTHFNLKFPESDLFKKIKIAHLGDEANVIALKGKSEEDSEKTLKLFVPTYQLKSGPHLWWFNPVKEAEDLRKKFGNFMFGKKSNSPATTT